MYNFANGEYLELLREMLDFFNNLKGSEFVAYDDTMIRFDNDTSQYVASVYILQ
jgi:hypothetical protein